jgi:nicotinamide mononucleotide adenylyltransferase
MKKTYLFEIRRESSSESGNEKHHVFAFGRMNPVTTGHERVIEKVQQLARKHNAGHTVVLSHSQDPKKNPLTAAQKLKHARRFFPKINFSASDRESPNFLSQLQKLHKSGVSHVHVVAGSDRIPEYEKTIKKYNGTHKGALFNFKGVTVHSAGDRDPDAEGTEGMSASKMREHATKGNFAEFRKGVPSHVSDQHAKSMYNDVRKGMNIHEDVFVEDMTSGQIYIPSNSHMPMSRGVMPQIKSADVQAFRAFMSQNGIRSSYETVPVDSLSATQAEFSKHKIKRLIDTNSPALGLMIMVSGDDYVLDGHHRWLANFNIDPKGMQKVLRFHAPMKRLIIVAKSFPGVTYKGLDEAALMEGVNDPGIFKAVFMAGGPGSGKDFVMKRVMGNFGFVEVSSDPFLSSLMNKAKLDLKMPEHEAEQRDKVRGRAKQLEQHKKELVIKGRLGIIINGVADDYLDIAQKKKDLEDLGYDTFMIFVNVSDEESKRRNIARGETGGRTVPEGVRSKKWSGAIENSGKFAGLFGRNFVEIDNSVDLNSSSFQARAKLEADFQNTFKKIRAFTSASPRSASALSWITSQRNSTVKTRGLIGESSSLPSLDGSFGILKKSLSVLNEHGAQGQGREGGEGFTSSGTRGKTTHPLIGKRSGDNINGAPKRTPVPKRAIPSDSMSNPGKFVPDKPHKAMRRKPLANSMREAKSGPDSFSRDFDTAMGSTAPIGSNPPAKGYMGLGYAINERAKKMGSASKNSKYKKKSSVMENIDDLLEDNI